jgi:hypothetical protein
MTYPVAILGGSSRIRAGESQFASAPKPVVQ